MMTTLLVLALLAAATMLGLALAASTVLGWANHAFQVEVDSRVTEIEEILPGVNCGGCGYVGCGEYAEAVVHSEEAVDLCAPGGASCAEAVAGVMGVDVEPSWPYRAVIHCGARTDQRLQRAEYSGEATCAAANLVAGVQGCTFGCLGLGDCVDVCVFEALDIVDGLAVIDYENCTGCGKCIDVCPRHIISRIPFKASQVMVVACSNEDFGNDVRKVCNVGCIGCKACERVTSLFHMRGNLPVLDYDIYDPVSSRTTAELGQSVEKCPMESLLWVGTPSEADLLAVANEELPVRAKADFETTVDKADWWG